MRSWIRRRADGPEHQRRSRPTGTTLVFGLAILATAYAIYHRTEAYRNGNRLFYTDGRPNRAGRAVGDLWVWAAASGFAPSYLVALETIGRRTGRRISVPVVLADHEGGRYVVSMLGERSPWVHNVRASGGHAVIRHGDRRAVRLVEVPTAERARILKAYLARAVGGRPHIRVDPDAPIAEFKQVAATYPVFRVEPADGPG